MRGMKLRFSLRTLFIVVALTGAASAFVAHENRIVQERKAIDQWAEKIPFCGAGYTRPPPPVSWVRRLLGDVGVESFTVPRGVSEREKDRIKAAFPEAQITDGYYYGGSLTPMPPPMPGDPPRPPVIFEIDAPTRRTSSAQ